MAKAGDEVVLPLWRGVFLEQGKDALSVTQPQLSPTPTYTPYNTKPNFCDMPDAK